jgi:hypothetical protein
MGLAEDDPDSKARLGAFRQGLEESGPKTLDHTKLLSFRTCGSLFWWGIDAVSLEIIAELMSNLSNNP